MAHRYTRRKITSASYLAPLAAATVILFPLSINHMDFRAVFARGVSVAAEKSSPAYAAFEDSRETYNTEFVIPDRGELLASGRKFDYHSAESLPRQRVIALRGMTVKAPPPAPVVESQPVLLATQAIKRTMAAPIAPASSYVDPHQDGWSISSLSERARQLVEAELLKGGSYRPTHKQIPTASGTTILVARGDNPPDKYIEKTPEPPAPVESLPVPPPVVNLASLNPAEPRPLWLNGQIEMTGGLAYVGPETKLRVKRVLNGTSYESARIWVTEGRFEMRVKSPIGFLVAELYTDDGRILGRGELNLLQLRDLPVKSDRINDLRIALRPTADTASLRTIEDQSPSEAARPVREARVEFQAYADAQPVNEDGIVSQPELDRQSSFVARASAPKHWSSLVIGQADHPQDIRLFSNSVVEALINLSLEGTDRAEAFHSAIVWGQISKNGGPVEGAQVEMAGSYQSVYFNDAYIPDPKMTATGKNGLFAFLRVKSGVQAVRVRTGSQMYPAQVFPAEEKHVSYLALELRDRVVSQFKVLDVLDMNKPVSARIRMVGTDAMLTLSGDDFVEYSVAADSFMIEAEAGPEYEVSRTTLTGSPHMVHVPLVKREWLHQLAEERGIPAGLPRGTVVGFVDDQDFDVEMTGSGPYERLEVVYFDAQGRALPGNNGVAGGGFAIFNAPPGLQTVSIHPVQSRGSFSQVVVAEPAYVHVMTWSASHPSN